MDFKIKIIFLIIFLFPLITFAVVNDYLFVSLNYDFSANKISILSVEQRSLDSSQVLISERGNFELFLIEKNRVVSRNTFIMPIDEEIEVLLEGGGGIYTKTDSYSTTVALPLNRSFDAEDLSFQVKKDGQVIFDEKFSADTFTVLEVEENTIKTLEPLAPGEKRAFLKYLLWAVAAFLVWFFWRWWMIRKKASESESDYMMR